MFESVLSLWKYFTKHSKYLVVLFPLVILSYLGFLINSEEWQFFSASLELDPAILWALWESLKIDSFPQLSLIIRKMPTNWKTSHSICWKACFPHRRKRKKKPYTLVHHAAEGVFLNSRQGPLMDPLCYVPKPFEFATREIISDDAFAQPSSPIRQITKPETLRDETIFGRTVCLAAWLLNSKWSKSRDSQTGKCGHSSFIPLRTLFSPFFVLSNQSDSFLCTIELLSFQDTPMATCQFRF